jgi:outer membrane receptor for ferrienterochelin and colicins
VLRNLFSNDSDINIEKNTCAVVIDYHKEKLHINFHGFYRGKNPAVKNQSSYFVASANITHQMSTQLKLNLSVSNIFDEHYKTQSIIYDEGVENKRRAVTFGVAYQL